MRVDVDYDKCQSAGVCESLSPHVFEVRADGRMYVISQDVSGGDQADVLDAVAACPSFALQISEASGERP